jgi:hypothetical protein
MRLLKDQQKVELDAAATEAVYLEAEQMVRAGVVLTPDYWESLADVERLAFVSAQESVHLERAMIQARLTTVKSIDELAPMVDGVDGGKAVARILMDETLARMVPSMNTPVFAREFTKVEVP